jgi:hypothetical protein
MVARWQATNNCEPVVMPINRRHGQGLPPSAEIDEAVSLLIHRRKIL